MYQQQEVILKEKTNINQWMEQYVPSAEAIHWDDIENFNVRVPLVGMFSSGKSSLLNTFFDTKLLPLDITPESGVAIELSYAEAATVRGIAENGVIRQLTVADLTNSAVATELVQQNGWIKAELNLAALKAFPHVSLVDLPGLGSGQDIHSKAIDNYMHRSLAYCIIVSAEDGELNASTQAFLKELSYHNSPVVLIVTKADKRHQDDIDAVAAKIKQSTETLINKPLLASVVVSRRDKAELQASMQAVMQALEKQSELVFQHSVSVKIIEKLKTINKQIDVLLNKEDLSSEELAAKQEQLRADMQRFEQQLQQETENLENSSATAVANITRSVQARVAAQRNLLAQALLNEGDINALLTPTIRMAVTEGMQIDFLPRVGRYIKKVDQLIPADIWIESNFKLEDTEFNDFNITSLSTVILSALKNIPALRIIAPAVNLLIDLLLGSSKNEDSQRQKLEKAGRHVDQEIIPKVGAEVSRRISEIITQQIQSIKQEIAKSAAQSSAELEHSMAEVRQQLQASAADFERQQQIYQADKTAINALIASLERV